jgi:ferredoxin--NADP+ reductase
VTVDGESRYACVDGPEFDGHKVDFRVLSDRLTTYRTFEQAAMERREACRIGGRTEPLADTPDATAPAGAVR